MKISALASGSSGNSFYIENDEKQAILVDAGISCKQIEERLNQINRTAKNVNAIFITHEHSDHIKGSDVFARKFQIPVYAPKKIAKECFLCQEKDLVKDISSDETIKIKKLEVTAFSKSHKSIEPVSYYIRDKNKKLSIITDAGYACKNVIEHVTDSNFLAIESNYDEKMLQEGAYPWFLKKWVSSDIGHLSNTQSACCVLENAGKRLKNLMLCHLSQNNNTPEKALETFYTLMKERLDIKPTIGISERFSATGLMRV